MIIVWKNKIFNTKYLKSAYRRLVIINKREEYQIVGKFDDGQEAVIFDWLSEEGAEKALVEIAENFNNDDYIWHVEAGE